MDYELWIMDGVLNFKVWIISSNIQHPTSNISFDSFADSVITAPTTYA